LPARGVLLHIGPHKTGTTAIQGALAKARPALRDRGIVYPGEATQHRTAALAVTDSKGAKGLREAREEDWERLVRHVHAARRRQVVVSSEAFVEANDTAARYIVQRLGGDRMHVVVTLRPLAKILPSAWQQNVRNQLTATFDEWLDDVLVKRSGGHRVKNFWHRHAHDVVIERWLSYVDPSRIVVVVADDANRRVLPQAFERLLNLPDGFLTLDDVRTNRGLTGSEIELVRLINLEFQDRGWSTDLYHKVVHHGVVRGMQARTPDPDEQPIVTPAWAVEKANEVAAAASARIRSLGVPVMGDLDSLGRVAPRPAPSDPVDLTVAAAEAALAGLRERMAVVASPPPLEGNARPLADVPTRELGAILRHRVVRRVNVALGRGIPRY
jgi:hypothetical protein